MEKIIYPYIRFSKEEQKKGASLHRQSERIKEYAKKNGFHLVDNLDLTDLGKSAYKGKNVTGGALGRFIEAIELGIIPTDGSAYLCIEQIDRLTRQDIDTASDLFRSILKKNVNIITLMDNKIYTKNSLKSFFDIMYSLFLMEQAYLESEKKSERILNVFDQRRAKLLSGQKIQFSGALPGWIDNNGSKENTDFVFNEKVEIVQKIFDLYGNQEQSLRDITNWLDKNNVPQIARKRQKNFTNRWNSGRVSHLLDNRCVIGELKIKKTQEVIEGYYPAAVDRELFEKVQVIKSRKIKIKSAGRRSINIFTGKLFCGNCGQKVYFETDDKIIKGKKYLYYTLKCSARRYGGCDSKTITYEHFMSSHPNQFEIFGIPYEYPKHLAIQKEKEISEVETRIEVLRDKLRSLEKAFESSENIDMDLFLKSGTKIKNTLRSLESELKSKKFEYNRYTQTNMFDTPQSTIEKLVIEENREEIEKAKKIIDRNYSAFILFGEQKQAVCLRYNGLYEFINWGNNTDTGELIKNFSKYTENLMKEWVKGKLDGKFTEIISSVFNWGEEKLRFKNLTSAELEELENDPSKFAKYDLGFFILSHWDNDILHEHLKKLNIIQDDFDYKNYGQYVTSALFKLRKKDFESMPKNVLDSSDSYK